MSRPSKLVVTSAAAGILAVGVGLGVAGYAAADPSSSPTAKPSASADAGRGAPGRGGPDLAGHGRGGPGRGDFDGDLSKQLAEKLGVDQAKVSDALKAIREANKPTARPSANPSADPSAKPSRPDQATRDAKLAKQLAEKLGIDEAKVTKAFEEIRAERQADRAKALKSRLDAAVKAGTLTQAEADAVTKAVEKGVIGGR